MKGRKVELNELVEGNQYFVEYTGDEWCGIIDSVQTYKYNKHAKTLALSDKGGVYTTIEQVKGYEFNVYEWIEVKTIQDFTIKELIDELYKREGVRKFNLNQTGLARVQEITFCGESLNVTLKNGAIILEVEHDKVK